MDNPAASEQELLATILPPLLDDFSHWFERAIKLLGGQRLTFLTEEEQNGLLERVIQARQEVQTARILFLATNQQAGVEMKVLMPWHQLVMECWQVGLRSRQREDDPDSVFP